MMHKVSVIMPVYNAEQHLRECLDSVLAQTLWDFEIICVDDGSTDASGEILAEYVKNDAVAGRGARFRVIRQEHSNAGAARNTGLREARGDYLLFLDSDDVFAPDMFRSLLDGIEAAHADTAICGFAKFNDGEPLPQLAQSADWRSFESPARTVDLFNRWPGWAWDKLFKRSFIRRLNLEFQETAVSNDLYFTYMALAHAERIAVSQARFVAHRYRAGSVETTRSQHPLCPAEAVRTLHDALAAEGILNGNAFRSFAKWVPDLLFWHVNHMADSGSRAKLFAELQKMGREWRINGSAKWIKESLKKRAVDILRVICPAAVK